MKNIVICSLICLCLIYFASAHLLKREIGDTFQCSNGEILEPHKVCDSFNDCINGADEDDEICGELLFTCGMGNENTVGTQFNFPNHPSSTFIDMADHRRISRTPDHTPDDTPEMSLIRNRRVVNGRIADSLENFPWIADLSILLTLDPGNKTRHPFNVHLCGGAIISEYFILTAAHCLKKTLRLAMHTNWTASLRVSIGEFDQSQPDLFEEDFHVETAVIHGGYNMFNYLVNDIGLIKLKAKNGHGIIFNQQIQPVCLPSANTPFIEGSLALAGGWGVSRTHHDIFGDYSRFIYLGEVPIKSLSLCQRFCNFFTRHNDTDPHCFDDKYLCVGYLEGGTDTCHGDSGGPLVQNINGRFTLLGLTSFGHPECGKAGYPAVYTNVQHFLPWILSTMRRLTSN